MDNLETDTQLDLGLNNAPEEVETEVDTESDDKDDKRSLRSTLQANFDAEDEKKATETPNATEESEPTQEVAPSEPAVERIPVVPPADMNKVEREAFLNPTPENSYILQQYMNRRAYETRSDYQRRVQEVEELKAQTSSVYETIKAYENDYAKRGISLGDIAKRSVAWDQAMREDPVTTALEWLETYGVSVNDLTNVQPQQPQQYNQYQQQPQQQAYLTREEAERIADEKFQAIQQQQQQNAVAYYNERVVESFVAAKPLFRDPETASQLEAEMAPIVQALTSTGRYSSPEEILETAYNYVVAGNPNFSSIHQAMTAGPVIEQKQAVVQKAKAASRSITGSAGSGTPRIESKNLRDNLRRRMSGD